MSFALELAGTPRAQIAQRVQAAAKVLNITHLLARKPKELSGGQRQRVAMGRAIVREPKVFLFDEPLSNLDAKLRGHMRIEIALLHRRLGKTAVYVTHDQIEAMTLADRIVVMDQGRIQQMGTPDEVFNRPLNQFVAGFIGNPGMNFLGHGRPMATACSPPATYPQRRPRPGPRPPVAGRRAPTPAVDDAAALTLPLRVDVCEYLGTETVLGCSCAAVTPRLWMLGTITLVVPGGTAAARGTCSVGACTSGAAVCFEPGGHGRLLTSPNPQETHDEASSTHPGRAAALRSARSSTCRRRTAMPSTGARPSSSTTRRTRTTTRPRSCSPSSPHRPASRSSATRCSTCA